MMKKTVTILLISVLVGLSVAMIPKSNGGYLKNTAKHPVTSQGYTAGKRTDISQEDAAAVQQYPSTCYRSLELCVRDIGGEPGTNCCFLRGAAYTTFDSPNVCINCDGGVCTRG